MIQVSTFPNAWGTHKIPPDRQPSDLDSEEFDGSKQFSANNEKCPSHLFLDPNINSDIQMGLTSDNDVCFLRRGLQKNMFHHILPLFPQEIAIRLTQKGICFRD
jgi:hypothetical protein